MSTKTPPARRPPREKPFKDRRAGPSGRNKAGSIRHLKGLLARPMGLERGDGALRVVFVERRRAPPALPQLLAELGSRLLAHERRHTTQVLRHLVYVHDELGRKGWPGVEVLPGRVLGKALVQAEMLASDEHSPMLATIVERLRALQLAAAARDDGGSRLQAFRVGEHVEVSETTLEAFNEIERSWVGTVPPGLVHGDAEK